MAKCDAHALIASLGWCEYPGDHVYENPIPVQDVTSVMLSVLLLSLVCPLLLSLLLGAVNTFEELCSS